MDHTPPQRQLAPLAGSDLYNWITLRRVGSGGISTTAGRWFDAGRQVPGDVADTLADLRESGLVMVIDPDLSGGAQAALTDAGLLHYGMLCQQRQITLTDTGCTRCAQLQGTPRRPELPDPQFSITTPAERGLAGPAVSRRWTSEHASLPIRSPGAHLHPLLRRVPVADRGGEGGTS